MTNKWQCIKCKSTKVQEVVVTTLENGAESVVKEDVQKIVCHSHVMRNLTESQYTKENEINSSGARDENPYRQG